MGGFHGGHSSGGHSSSGGFHSGSHHSSSSYHSSGSYSNHHSSGSYGSYHPRPHVVHTVRDGRHYLGGRRYYGAYYGMKGDKPRTFASLFMTGFLFFCIGLVFFITFFKVGVSAVVTHASKSGYSYDQYEVYDFEYTFNGTTYYGYGDDDLGYDGQFTVLVGETYQLYVNPINPASYSFENNSALGIILFGILGTIGFCIMAKAVMIKRKHDEELALVGDANGDGVINDADLEYADAKNKGEADGAYEGTFRATNENEYQKKKILRRCPYCDSILDDNAKFCSQCGSNLK